MRFGRRFAVPTATTLQLEGEFEQSSRVYDYSNDCITWKSREVELSLEELDRIFAALFIDNLKHTHNANAESSRPSIRKALSTNSTLRIDRYHLHDLDDDMTRRWPRSVLSCT